MFAAFRIYPGRQHEVWIQVYLFPAEFQLHQHQLLLYVLVIHCYGAECPKLSSLKHKHSLCCLIFEDQLIQEWLLWVVWLRVAHEVTVKLLARNAVIWRLQGPIPRSFLWVLAGFHSSLAVGGRPLFLTMWASPDSSRVLWWCVWLPPQWVTRQKESTHHRYWKVFLIA